MRVEQLDDWRYAVVVDGYVKHVARSREQALAFARALTTEVVSGPPMIYNSGLRRKIRGDDRE